MPQGGGGVGGTGLSAEQLLQLQQLGVLGKPATAPAAAAAGPMTAQQQAALLNALQASGQPKGLPPNLAAGLQLQQQQQQRAGGPPGLANGAAFLGQQSTQQMQQRPVHQQHQHQHQQHQQQLQQASLQQANLLAALGGGGQRPPLAPQQGGARVPAGALGAALGGRAGGDGQSDPIQTLQDIGKTLAQLNITVEAAVNAGLLGGLSASGGCLGWVGVGNRYDSVPETGVSCMLGACLPWLEDVSSTAGLPASHLPPCTCRCQDRG